MTHRNDDEESEKQKSVIGLALNLGFGIAIPLALFIVGGVWLDGLLNTRPLFILLGIFLGFVSAGLVFWQLISASVSGGKKN